MILKQCWTNYKVCGTIFLFLCTLHLALPSASCSSALTVRGREQLYLCYEGYHCFAFFQDFEVDCRAVLRAGRESWGHSLCRGPDAL